MEGKKGAMQLSRERALDSDPEVKAAFLCAQCACHMLVPPLIYSITLYPFQLLHWSYIFLLMSETKIAPRIITCFRHDSRILELFHIWVTSSTSIPASQHNCQPPPTMPSSSQDTSQFLSQEESYIICPIRQIEHLRHIWPIFFCRILVLPSA